MRNLPPLSERLPEACLPTIARRPKTWTAARENGCKDWPPPHLTRPRAVQWQKSNSRARMQRGRLAIRAGQMWTCACLRHPDISVDRQAPPTSRRRRSRLSEDHTTAAPLQVLLSKNFGRTIRHAMSLAIAREHDAVTSEHLLLALADDPDAAAVMRACGVDLDTLRRALAAALERQPAAQVSRVHAIVQRAADHLHDTVELEVNGAHVLMAMLTDPAAEHLYAQGMAASDATARIDGALRRRVPAPAARRTGGPSDARRGQAVERRRHADGVRRDGAGARLRHGPRGRDPMHVRGAHTWQRRVRHLPAGRRRRAGRAVLDLARAHGHELRCVVT